MPAARLSAQAFEVAQYAHTGWLHRDLLPKGRVIQMAQTPDWYLWLGTTEGLFRFDGIRAVRWRPPNGQQLPSELVVRLQVTRDGTLWIATTRGLSAWKDGTLTSYPMFDNKAVSTPLYEGADGTIWVGTRGQKTSDPVQICTIRAGNVLCDDASELRPVVVGFAEDRDGILWVAAANGIWRWRPAPRTHVRPPSNAYLSKMVEGHDGALIVQADQRLLQMVGERFEPFPVQGVDGPYVPSPETPNRIALHRELFRSRDGALWLATSQGVFHVHHGRTDRFTAADGLTSDFVMSFFEDAEGNVWVNTLEGLDRFRPVAAVTISERQGLSSSTAWSVQATPDGSVWVGTSTGLNRVTIDAGGARVVERTGPEGPVYALGLNGRGQLLAAAGRRLLTYRDGRFVPSAGVTAGPVASITVDAAGDTWTSDISRGLFRWPQSGVAERVGGFRDEGSVRVLLSDPRGGLWLGLRTGGIAYLPPGGVTATVSNGPESPRGAVSDVRLGSDGAVWASASNGITRVKNGRATKLDTKSGLPCNNAHWTIEDAGHAIWTYLGCGLVRIDRSEWQAWVADPARRVRVTSLGPDEGVKPFPPGHAVGPLVTRSVDGRIWFIAPHGVSVLDPRQVPMDRPPPIVRIEELRADGITHRSSETAAGRLRLGPSLRNLEIHYTPQTLTAPEKVRYRFMLEGQDRDWREAGNQRDVTYSNLAPGTYEFRVAAASSSGGWHPEGTVLHLEVMPALHQTRWFQALAVTPLLALVWGLHRLRLHNVQRRERRFRDALETMPAMAFTALPDGVSTFVSSRWVEYTGLSHEQTSRSGWLEVAHPHDLERVRSDWHAALVSGKPFEHEVRLRSASGAHRWFLVRAVPLPDERGRIVRWQGVAADIEDRKRAEEERRRFEQALERARSELTHVARVTSLGALTASITHEVNQPLSGIITNASTCLRMLAANEPDIDGARETARRTIRDGHRAAEVVTRLRALFARKEFVDEVVDLNETVREVLALSSGEVERHRVLVQLELDSSLPPVRGDRVQLQQVVLNLLVNACQAMGDISGRQRQLVIRTDGQENFVRLVLRDTGPGIPQDMMDRLFQPFFTTKAEGMGIGLSVSRSIAERHGGRLWAEPSEGHGATFVMTLPRS